MNLPSGRKQGKKLFMSNTCQETNLAYFRLKGILLFTEEWDIYAAERLLLTGN
jgi:hypothetical protein